MTWKDLKTKKLMIKSDDTSTDWRLDRAKINIIQAIAGSQARTSFFSISFNITELIDV